MKHDDRCCRTCGASLPESAFYQRKDGYVVCDCKPCFNAAGKNRRLANRERYKASAALRAKRYRSTEAYAARSKANAARTKARHPEANKARRKLNHAIHVGALSRPFECSCCGDVPPLMKDGRSAIQAHHHNGYSNALDVVWLCAACHVEAHRALRCAHAESGSFHAEVSSVQ